MSLDQVLGKVVSGIAGCIGLASEGITAYKKRSSRANLEESSSIAPSPHIQSPDDKTTFVVDDEEQWELDDAQDELINGASSDDKSPRDVGQLTDTFVLRYPPPAYTEHAPAPRLAFPVILPQRRPKDRSRGFIRAYAPALAHCGIDQATFLDFLETFNQASLASPWLSAINLAALGTSFLPHGIAIAVSIAIQTAVGVAIEIQSRSRLVHACANIVSSSLLTVMSRTNSFLNQINNEFFRPRGLYCLIMTWNPESSETHTSVNITSTISSSLNTTGSGLGQKLKNNLRVSSGNTYGDLEFPETAPLIFPGLDSLAAQTGEEAVRKRDKLKKGQNFVEEYWDRRAQAKYVCTSLYDSFDRLSLHTAAAADLYP
jgi:hypothetical protein